MESLHSKRYTLRTFLVATLCLSGAGAGAYFLYRDLMQGESAFKGTPIANLERRAAKVRRKPASSYVWQHIDENSPIYLKESIQTGPESAAIVRLENGTVLELGENSLVVIDRTAELSLNYLKGSIVLRDDSGDKQITADASGKAKVRELAIRLLKPEMLSEYFVDGNTETSLEFSWESRAATPVFVEISPDRAFRRPRVRRLKPDAGAAGNLALAKGLPTGTYFWRVKTETGDASQIRSFKISSVDSLVPVSPTASARLESFGEKSAIQFRWKPAQLAGSAAVTHELEVASDPAFRSIVSRQAIAPASGVASANGISSGQYYWRIRSRYGKIEKLSSIERFTVEHTEKVALKLLGPAEDSLSGIQPELRFVWAGGSHADLSYSWELQDASGADVASAKGNATAAVWKSLRAGAFRWRVSATWEGRPVGSTEWRNLNISEGDPIALIAPANGQEIYFWDKEPEFAFKWKADPLAKGAYSYELQIASDREFHSLLSSGKTSELSQPSAAALGSANGALFWRVRIVDTRGRAVKTSEARILRYGKHPLLAAPTPAPGRRTYNLRDDEEPLVLRWAPVPQARGYEITLIPEGRQPASGERLVIFSEKNSFTVPELPEGKYHWTVRAVDQIDRRGDASQGELMEITFGAPLPAPKILSREVQ